MRKDEDKAERNDEAEKIARNHNSATIEPIEQHTRKRAGKHGGQRAGDHHTAYGNPGTGQVQC